MNVGLVTGYVLRPDGRRAGSDGTVYLQRIHGDVSPIGFVGARGPGRASAAIEDGKFGAANIQLLPA